MYQILRDLRCAKLDRSLIRKLLSFYYTEGRDYTIAFGPLRGMKLRYDRSITFHEMLGLHELPGFKLLSTIFGELDTLGEDAIVCDVGANIGLYSLWFSRFLSTAGHAYAFEPSPISVERLRHNLKLNNITNVSVETRACTDVVGTTRLFIGSDHHSASLDAEWAGSRAPAEQISVQATTLDHFFYDDEHRPPPDFIKMDIEGGGTSALKGCDRCIQHKRPLFLIESHTPEEDRAIGALLVSYDYQAYRLDDGNWVQQPTEPHPHPEGVWGTLLLCPIEMQVRLLQLLE